MALKIPLRKSDLGQKSTSFMGPSIWNKLSSDLKIFNTATLFTHNNKKFVNLYFVIIAIITVVTCWILWFSLSLLLLLLLLLLSFPTKTEFIWHIQYLFLKQAFGGHWLDFQVYISVSLCEIKTIVKYFVFL